MVTFSRAYPRAAFWYGVLIKPFVVALLALFKLTWLVSKWMTVGAFKVYAWAFVALRKKFAPRVA